MTSSAIQDVTGISYAGGKVQGKKSSYDPADDSVGSFQNAMNLAKGNDQSSKSTQTISVQKTAGCEYQTDSTGAREVKKQESTAKTEKTADNTAKDSTQDTEAKESKKTEDSVVSEAVDKKTEELEKEVVKEIADELDVTKEEVTAAMEALGLTFMDLTNQADMAALAAELTADGDSMAVLTDENLFTDIVELTGQITDLIEAGANELSEELSVDISDIMDRMMEAAADTQPALTDEAAKQPVMAEQKAVMAEPEAKVTYEIDNQTSHAQDMKEASAGGEEAVTVVQDSENARMSQKREDSSDSGHDMMHHADAQPMASAIETDAAQAAETAATPKPYTQVDAQDIIDQIAKHVRVQNTAEFSEVEMSLHPASLGNIHLQVTAREGVITAQIAAENESVKDALLVQAMVLKEELNEQGLKIEAVEVTVASHEFEQNMQGENGENAEQMYEEQVKKDTRRRIMLSGLDEAEELLADENLTEAERIRIEMMAKSGSSMDMLA